jgi:hypothetical protein
MINFNKYKNQSSFVGKSQSSTFSYEQLINYYPRHHIFDELLTSLPNVSHINFFIDLKNIMQTTYLEFAIRYLLNDSNDRGFLSPLIFESFMAFIGFHKDYVLTRNKTANFYVFFETGESGYHKRIFKDYKSNRNIDKAFGLTQAELNLKREILQKNLILIRKVGNRLPNVTVIHLENLEADFIPYYLISRKLVRHGEDVLNLTYSTDHDLYQNTLCSENSYIFYRRKQNLSVFTKNLIIKKYVKKKNFESTVPPEFYPIFIACTGDTGDGIPTPFKGAGPVTINKHVEDFIELCGGVDTIYEKATDLNCEHLLALNNVDFENINLNNTLQKFIDNEEKILRNLRLMSFEVLSTIIDKYGNNTLMEKRKYIREIITQNNNYTKPDILLKSLKNIKIFLNESHYNKVFLSSESSMEDKLNSI